MELIFKHFEKSFAFINEQHHANLEYWDDATVSVKYCINKIVNLKEDQKNLKISR